MTATVEVIKDIIAKLKRVNAAELASDSDIVDEIGLDSLEMLQFMLELEERLAIQIDFDALDFSYLHSISRLADFLETMPARLPVASTG